MGINDRENERRENKRVAKRQRILAPTDPVTAEDINGDTLRLCLHRINAEGGALRIGHTRDHGAWAIGVYGDGKEPYTDYVRDGEDINEYLRKLGEHFAGLAEPIEK